jgi:hypothetical protein
MQKIEETTIKLNRGDTLNINLTIKKEDETDYLFEEGDKITFSIYNKGKLNEKAVLLKEINTTPGTTSVNIYCDSEETKIGELVNKPVDYWYEIELNDEYTILGYDDKGAKLFKLYPEGSKIQ